nr:hypothetical protein [Tanacetum cinerariifolium]
MFELPRLPDHGLCIFYKETVTLCARVETLKQDDEVTRDSLRITRSRITLLQLRVVAAEQQATYLHDS